MRSRQWAVGSGQYGRTAYRGRSRACWRVAGVALLLLSLLIGVGPDDGRADGLQDVRVDPDLLAGVEDKAPVRSADENYYEARAYNYLLLHAHKVRSADLAQ